MNVGKTEHWIKSWSIDFSKTNAQEEHWLCAARIGLWYLKIANCLVLSLNINYHRFSPSISWFKYGLKVARIGIFTRKWNEIDIVKLVKSWSIVSFWGKCLSRKKVGVGSVQLESLLNLLTFKDRFNVIWPCWSIQQHFTRTS